MMKFLLFSSVVFASLNIAWSRKNVVSKNNTMCIKPECNCCLESVLCVNASCGGQCKDGYHGGRCRNNCPQNCITCLDADNPDNNATLWGVSNCTECKPGYFSTSEFYQCQFSCSSPCQTCMSETVCISCVQGYYLSGTTCHQCIQECTACLSQTICSSCHDGYYLSGTTCRRCSLGCTAGQCSKVSGICQCKATFTRDKCDRCIDGRFGEDCLSYCPANCRYDNCDKISGSCLGDCFSDFSGDQCCLEGPGCQYCASEHICAECIPGKHGSLCDKDCPENCVDRLCHKDTGVCHYVKKPDRIGIIVGGVTGTLVVIAMVTAFIFFYRRRRYILQEGTLNAGSRINKPSKRGVPNMMTTQGPEQLIYDEHLNEAYDNFAADDQETEEHNYEDVLDQTSSK